MWKVDLRLEGICEGKRAPEWGASRRMHESRKGLGGGAMERGHGAPSSSLRSSQTTDIASAALFSSSSGSGCRTHVLDGVHAHPNTR